MIKIETALALKPGARVRLPADRGQPAATGTITTASSGQVHRNIHGRPYTWLTVKPDRCRHAQVWPSNRIEAIGAAA